MTCSLADIPLDGLVRPPYLIILVITLWVVNMDVTGSNGAVPCRRQEFNETDNAHMNGIILVEKGPWRWEMCRRLCRQFLECLVFKMTWIDKDGKIGICTIYKGPYSRNALVHDLSATLYWSCPAGMVYDLLLDICHSAMAHGPASLSEALVSCSNIYNVRGSGHTRLLSMRAAVDLYAFKVFGSEKNLWLGIHRVNTTNPNEFRYILTGELVTYTNWASQEPNMQPEGANYAAALADDNYEWYEVYDDMPDVYYMCELK